MKIVPHACIGGKSIGELTYLGNLVSNLNDIVVVILLWAEAHLQEQSRISCSNSWLAGYMPIHSGCLLVHLCFVVVKHECEHHSCKNSLDWILGTRQMKMTSESSSLQWSWIMPCLTFCLAKLKSLVSNRLWLSGDDLRRLENGVHVVSGTPGRVFDMIKRRALRTRDILMLVLDEADEMLNKGFKEQIYDVYRYLPPETQAWLSYNLNFACTHALTSLLHLSSIHKMIFGVMVVKWSVLLGCIGVARQQSKYQEAKLCNQDGSASKALNIPNIPVITCPQSYTCKVTHCFCIQAFVYVLEPQLKSAHDAGGSGVSHNVQWGFRDDSQIYDRASQSLGEAWWTDSGRYQAILCGCGERGVEIWHTLWPLWHTHHHTGSYLLQHKEEGESFDTQRAANKGCPTILHLCWDLYDRMPRLGCLGNFLHDNWRAPWEFQDEESCLKSPCRSQFAD